MDETERTTEAPPHLTAEDLKERVDAHSKILTKKGITELMDPGVFSISHLRGWLQILALILTIFLGVAVSMGVLSWNGLSQLRRQVEEEVAQIELIRQELRGKVDATSSELAGSIKAVEEQKGSLSNLFQKITGIIEEDVLSIGLGASSTNRGVAVGTKANASERGTAVGMHVQANRAGVGVGHQANANNRGTALGVDANAYRSGVAAGYQANAYFEGIAVGQYANGNNGNVAIGHRANAGYGRQRIAIGRDVENDIDDSTRLRGALYLDGCPSINVRPTFDKDGWTQGKSITVAIPTNFIFDVDVEGGTAVARPQYGHYEFNAGLLVGVK